jgi:hypothetical protein
MNSGTARTIADGGVPRKPEANWAVLQPLPSSPTTFDPPIRPFSSNDSLGTALGHLEDDVAGMAHDLGARFWRTILAHDLGARS